MILLIMIRIITKIESYACVICIYYLEYLTENKIFSKNV